MLATESVIHRYTEGRDISLYITEMGWPTYSGANGISPEGAAAYLGQMFLLSRTMNFIKGIWWYDFRDDGWDKTNKENDFGLVGPDLKPKPAFAALKAVSPIVRNAKGVEDLPTSSPSLHALRFRLNGDNQVLALWNTNQAGAILVHVKGSVLLQIRSIDKDSDAYSVGANTKEETMEISNAPVLVTGATLDFTIIK
jgi:polysaccharide biosynthesis protein PslG